MLLYADTLFCGGGVNTFLITGHTSLSPEQSWEGAGYLDAQSPLPLVHVQNTGDRRSWRAWAEEFGSVKGDAVA